MGSDFVAKLRYETTHEVIAVLLPTRRRHPSHQLQLNTQILSSTPWGKLRVICDSSEGEVRVNCDKGEGGLRICAIRRRGGKQQT
jgi:hypothetical protein